MFPQFCTNSVYGACHARPQGEPRTRATLPKTLIPARRDSQTKVFCFFFSKKKSFLPLCPSLRPLQRHPSNSTRSAFPPLSRERIKPAQHSPRQGDIHPLDRIIQSLRRHAHHPDDPPRIRRVQPHRLQTAGRRHSPPSIQGRVDPSGSSLLSRHHSLLQCITCGKAPRQIRKHHAKRRALSPRLNSNRITHAHLLQTSLLANGRHQANTQIRLRVRNRHMPRPALMLEHVMRPTHPIELPSRLLQLPDKIGALHVCIIHTQFNPVHQIPINPALPSPPKSLP